MKYIVALDIGGTKIEGVLFNEKYDVLEKRRVYFRKKKNESTVSLPRDVVLDMICGLVEDLMQDCPGNKKENRDGLAGIGISIPNIIFEGKIVGTCKILALSDFDLEAYLKKRFSCENTESKDSRSKNSRSKNSKSKSSGCKIRIANDADCFALGEARLGAGKTHDHVVGIIYGTGIGSGIVINNMIYSGTTGSAGEFGHNVVDPSGTLDAQGIKGTVESFAGGPDLIRDYKRAGGKLKNPMPSEIFASKERAAKKTVDRALERLAMGIAGLMNTLNPGIFVLGGGQSNMPIYKELNRRTKKYTIDGLRKHVRIVKNKLGDSAGIYGAAALVLEK